MIDWTIHGQYGLWPVDFQQKKRRRDAPLLFFVTFSTVARSNRMTFFLIKTYR